MQIHRNRSLQPYHTFGISAKALGLVEVYKPEELLEAWNFPEFKDHPKLILGGGSNVLFASDFAGLVILNRIKGIERVTTQGNHVYIRIMSGENWHECVEYTLQQGWYGLENLSLIPGTVGAAPMQNIGAYGVELKDVFHSLTALHLKAGQTQTFNAAQCKLGYRESIFKNELKGQYFIQSVTLKLSTLADPKIHYGDIQSTLQALQLDPRKPEDISRAVIHIRQSKLPDPKELGNSGSFFKNPIIPNEHFERIKAQWPQIKGYATGNEGYVKVAAGWLIEQCGFKGKRYGQTGSHAKQALVLVNYGNAKGKDVKELAEAIQQSVFNTFNIHLTPEVNIIETQSWTAKK